MAERLDGKELRQLWERAVAEDGAERDVTSLVTLDEHVCGTGIVVARQPVVFAGAALFDLLREAYGPRLTVTPHVNDGDALRADAPIATLVGPTRLLLGIERTLLNFLQRLCGVATITRRYVDAIVGTSARIYDTRKTVPGWRQLDKYAVRCGGGRNHRTGLHDAILVKDNHLACVGLEGLAAAAADTIDRAGALVPPPQFVEFEVDTLEQLDTLLAVRGIDIILLDNFAPPELRDAVRRRDAAGLAGKVRLEASGNVDLDSVRAIAEAGVERISVGALTHSVPAADIAMDVVGSG